MAHDACLQSAFSTRVGISGYCISGGVQIWQENKEPSSTILQETLILLSSLGCHREEFLCSRGRGWFPISNEAKACPSIANCLLRTVVREVEPFLQILTM